MKRKHTVLIMDDEAPVREELRDFLTINGYSVREAANLVEAKDHAADSELMLLDICLPDGDGLSLLPWLAQQKLSIAVLVISGKGDIQSVIRAFREGAVDYLSKPIDLHELQVSLAHQCDLLDKALDAGKAKSEYRRINENLQHKQPVRIIGGSRALEKVLNEVSVIAPLEYLDVLITGESGVGKELIAKLIHQLGSRRHQDYYAINCGAIAEGLFESELFGHTRNAFTGAGADKAGALEAVGSGLLILDEVSSLPWQMQTKLLRVLEEKTFRRVGSNKELRLQARIIAISNQNLEEMATSGRFRLDLFHRLNQYQITVPPLRERSEDIPALCEYFIKEERNLNPGRQMTIDNSALDLLREYNFPGNVRELRNLLRRAVISAGDAASVIRVQDFQGLSPASAYGQEIKGYLPLSRLQELERIWIENALADNRFQIERTAKALEVDRYTLTRRLAKYGIKIK
jgi:DNA-binding NtrC family response regulator